MSNPESAFELKRGVDNKGLMENIESKTLS
jgi:hypothetical protein